MQIQNALITGSFSYNGADLSNITSSNAYSASLSIRTTNLESTASSLVGASSSFSSRTTQVENTYASTGSNTFTGVQNFSNTCNPIGFNSVASVYTAGGLQVTYDSYFSSSVFVNGNLTVFGTQSVVHVSSSQFNIGTNIITVNTSTPSIRYGGLSVYDSGSTGLSGSIFWDSEANHWIYANASGSGGGATYSGGMFISGPRSSGLGCEQGTTSCMLLVGQGGDHLTSSLIYHDSTKTCFYGTSLFVSSSCSVGIGLNNPTNRLEVQSGDIKLNAGASRCTSVFFGITGTNYGKIQYSDMDGSMLITTMGAGSGYDLNLGTKCIIRLTISGGGNVGICNTNPQSPLSFANSISDKIDFYNDGVNRYSAQINSGELRLYTTSTDDVISLYANNVVGLVNKNRKVAISHTNPVDQLDIMGSLRIRCNTGDFTAACNSLVIDYANVCIFGSSPMTRYYSIGCTGVSAGHTFIVGQPSSPFNAMTISGAGQVTKPCSAAFYATINTTTNIGTPMTQIAFNCVVYNAAGAYNGTTSTFTAPVSGMYQFNFVFLNQDTPNTTGGHAFLKTSNGNGTYYFTRYGCNAALSSSGYGSYVPMHGAIAVYMPANATACVGAFWDATGAHTHVSSDWAFFSGYLVG